MFNFIILFKILLFYKEIAFLNSPLQLINYNEIKEANRSLSGIPIIIGFTSKKLERRIRYVEKYLNLKNIFYLSDTINVSLVHFIFNLRKYLNLNLRLCIVGDINYYLHKKIIKLGYKKIIVEDGSATLNISLSLKNLNLKNLKLFTLIKDLRVKGIKVHQLKLNILKNKVRKKIKIKRSKIHIISSNFHEAVKNPNSIYKALEKVKKTFSKYDVYYIPHPRENFKWVKNKYNFKILKINIPIEIYYIKNNFLPKKIIFNYSSSLFTIYEIFNRKNVLLNMKVENKKNIIDKKTRYAFKKYDDYLNKIKITNQIF